MLRFGLISSMNSIRVELRVRNTPSIAEVTALEFDFSTPRIIMHRWNASITTATPWGWRMSISAVAIFCVIVPAYERQILDHKREMISELTQSAVSILAEYEREERAGTLSREEAQREAVTRLRFLRYGEEGKDYFWVTDMRPVMVMHPYRPDLEGQDLSGFADPGGKRLFVEMVSRARADGAGYVEYVWQWKDDPSRIVPKTTSAATGTMAFRAVLKTRGFSIVVPGSSFITLRLDDKLKKSNKLTKRWAKIDKLRRKTMASTEEKESEDFTESEEETDATEK